MAEAPIEGYKVPARRKHNISKYVEIIADKFGSDLNFVLDFGTGVLNFTSGTTLHGKASLFNLFKTKATSSFTTCDISIYVKAKRLDSVCESRFRE